MSEWIPVTERLPEWLEKCLCMVIVPENGGGSHNEYRILHIDDINANKPKFNCTGMIVTHWMPLPEPPKKEESENARHI